MFCRNCGKEIDATAKHCPECGAAQDGSAQQVQQPQIIIQNTNTNTNTNTNGAYLISPKSKIVALLLAIFLGMFGFHRFYAGKIGTGIIWIFTCGLFGIGWICDIITILCGHFTDGAGMPIRR